MGKPIGPKKVHRYSNEFKVQAVRLSLHPEIPTQDVATALDIHPFMLSRWKRTGGKDDSKPVTKYHDWICRDFPSVASNSVH